MTDNKDLIAEAREFLRSENAQYYDSSLIGALADALEAATERASQAEAELRDVLRVDIPSLKAERDAALAAIERVRAINTGNNRALYGNNFEAGMAKALWLVKTALDGAPEPEGRWEYGVKWRDSQNPVWYHPYTVEEAEKNLADWPMVPGYVVRRQPAGPWLPVEGEKP